MDEAPDLDRLWPDIQKTVQADFKIFPASLRQNGGMWTLWPDDRSIDEFIEWAKSLKVAVMYAGIEIFTRDDLESLSEQLAEIETEELSDEAQALVTSAATNLDRIRTIHLSFSRENVAHSWVLEATWHVSLMLEAEDVLEARRVVTFAERTARVESWARDLAKHPQFQRASSETTRLQAARKLIPDLERAWEDELPIGRRIVIETERRALEIFRDEIKPEQERQLAAEAKEMLQRGMRKYEVAAKLGIGTGKLNRLLAEYEL
jgi:sugar phosphate isomerase/epimerase